MVKMKLDWKNILGLVLPVLLILSGCGSADEETDCVYHLNQGDYSKVATDSTCSTYERASAYMGMAGFKFSNFLVGDASENFRQALGIPDSVTSWNSWVGKTYYENAMQLSGDSTGDTYEGQTRSMEDVEVHYFASLAALTALTYIEMDADSDGEVSEDEIQGFTSIKSSDDTSYGQNELAPAEYFQFVTDKGTASEEVYLMNMSSGECINQTTPEYDGIWDNYIGDTVNTCGVIPGSALATWAAAGEGSVSGECTIVVQVEELQDMFGSSSGSSMSVVDLTESFVSYINGIDNDMVELGIETDSDLRQQLNDFSANIDNGGTCSNDTVDEVNQIFDILEAATENAVADYENVNVLSFDTVVDASDTAIASGGFSIVVIAPGPTPVTVTFSCTNANNLLARLIYNDLAGTDYVPYYSGATANINDTFNALKDLNTDADGNVKPTVAGDEVISIKELICME